MHVENSAEGRDLSPVTNKLWKKFYEKQFGAKSTDLVVGWMKQSRVSFKWKQLYEAKTRDLEAAQQKSFDRIKELYKKEDARKQSRQVQICTNFPPSSSKRSFYGGGPGSSISNMKSNVMKGKTGISHQEVKNLAAMKNNSLQRNYCISFMRKPGGFSGQVVLLLPNLLSRLGGESRRPFVNIGRCRWMSNVWMIP